MTDATKTEQSYVLKQDFEKVFHEYPNERMKKSSTEPSIIPFFRNELINDIRNLIISLPYNKVLTSVGMGVLPLWPRVIIDFEKINKLDLNFTYIFKEDMSGVYLSINYTNKDSPIYFKEKINIYRQKIKDKFQCEKFLEPVNLGHRNNLSGYIKERIIISKFYSADSIPSDQELLKDLKIFLDYVYFLYNEEKLEEIDNINNLIKNLEYQIKIPQLIIGYDNVILQGSKICEMMVRLYLKKENYDLSDEKYKSLGQIIKFCDQKNLLPKNCIDYLNTIRCYRNDSAHGTQQDNNISKTYLKNLNYFLIWFNEFYSQRYFIKNPFQINEISSLIQPIIYDEENSNQNHLMKLDEEKRELENVSIILYEKIESLMKQLDESNEEIDSLKNQLNENSQNIKKVEKTKQDLLLEEIAKGIERIDATTQRTEEKVDLILNYLNDVRAILQKVTERQIRYTNSLEKRERILEDFTKDYLEDVFQKYLENILNNADYEREKRKLELSFGESSWNKLSDKSKTFLISSKVMYHEFLMIEDMVDYSGVCILVTKALEEEIFQRFFVDFIEYLAAKYGDDYSKYHTSIIHTKRDGTKSILFEDNFTMGSIAFVLCFKDDRKNSNEENKNNKRVLIDYCKENIFSNRTEEEIKLLLEEFARNIERIRKDYRNPSAHRNGIKRIHAKECFDLVLDVEKLLKRMLDSFDY